MVCKDCLRIFLVCSELFNQSFVDQVFETAKTKIRVALWFGHEESCDIHPGYDRFLHDFLMIMRYHRCLSNFALNISGVTLVALPSSSTSKVNESRLTPP